MKNGSEICFQLATPSGSAGIWVVLSGVDGEKVEVRSPKVGAIPHVFRNVTVRVKDVLMLLALG
jgi:hypothetical protein